MSQTARAADFASHHGKALAGGLIVFVLVVGAVLFFRANRTTGSGRAAGLLAEARVTLQQGNLDAASITLDELVENHGNTVSGKQGRLLAADVRYAQGQNQEAADMYRKALQTFGDDGIFTFAARRGLAASLENLGSFEEAAGLYATLAETAPNTQLRAELKMSEARARSAAGQDSEALSIYEELSRLDDNPRVVQDAKIRMAEARRAS